jgi:oxalate decarboxylase/phosphoglucose isomerase-like protein (cupin superfamily)
VKGEFRLKLGDRIVSAPAQSVMFVPRGMAHTFQNVGTEPGVILVGVTPGGFERMFEERQRVDAETNRALAKKYNMEVVGRRSSERLGCQPAHGRRGAADCGERR